MSYNKHELLHYLKEVKQGWESLVKNEFAKYERN